MKLSNQNIYNLRGCKNFWGRCQMPQCKSFLGGCTPTQKICAWLIHINNTEPGITVGHHTHVSTL